MTMASIADFLDPEHTDIGRELLFPHLPEATIRYLRYDRLRNTGERNLGQVFDISYGGFSSSSSSNRKSLWSMCYL